MGKNNYGYVPKKNKNEFPPGYMSDDQKWIEEAKEYAKSRNENHLDFTDISFWLDYKNNYGLTPVEAVDDHLIDY